jgi:hypothetical protein
VSWLCCIVIVQGCRNGSKSGGGGAHLAPTEGGWCSWGSGGRPPGKSLKLESLKCHFLHFRRRFTLYRVLKVTKCHKISQIVLSTCVTEIISINFVVYYWPLLKSGGAQTHLGSPTKKVAKNLIGLTRKCYIFLVGSQINTNIFALWIQFPLRQANFLACLV